jgi:hypothetical protein
MTVPASRERPVLLLGLLGFAAEDECRIGDAIAHCSSRQVSWRISGFAGADAWLVNGSRTRVLDGDELSVAPATAAAPVRFSLSDIDRPIAFSQPPASTEFEPTVSFSLESEFTIHEVLARFSFWLRTRASQLCLAAQLLEREAVLVPGGVYHVCAAGRLLAVVDRRGDIGILRTASPFDFDDAAWRSRPTAAGYIPETFERASLSMLIWQYALRSQRDLLPERYRSSLIHYRRPPKLEQRVVSDGQLRLLRELSAGPCRFADLMERTAAPAAKLAHDLAALYLVGSITTNPQRASQLRSLLPAVDRDPSQSPIHSDWPSRPAHTRSTDAHPLALKDTAPAPIRRQPSTA